MPEFSQQFRQPAFYGYGDSAMRSRRVTPAAQPASQTPAARPSSWSQPELPEPTAAPAKPARLTPASQARARINTARTKTREARVATAESRAEAAQHRLTTAQARTSAAQRTAQAAQRATAPAAGPVHGPQTRMDALRSQPARDNTLPPSAPGPTPQPRTVTINRATIDATDQRFGPEPVSDQNISMPGRPAPPPPTGQAAPPATPASGSSPAPSGAGRAARYGGLAIGLGAKAFESVNRISTDPKRSGNPKYESSGGWAKS